MTTQRGGAAKQQQDGSRPICCSSYEKNFGYGTQLKRPTRPIWVCGAAVLAALITAGPSNGQAEDPDERLEAIESEAKAAMEKWMANLTQKMEEAQSNGEEPDPTWFEPPIEPYMKRARAAYEEYAGEPEAFEFLLWMARTATSSRAGEQGTWALDTILSKYPDSDDLFEIQSSFPELAMRGLSADRIDALLAKVEEANPDEDTRAWASYARSMSTVENAEVGSSEYVAAKEKFLAAASAIGDVWIARSAESKVNVREKFGHGMTAPDIAGVDLDNQPFQLSDYKGKVLFVDFWGDW